MVLPHSTRRDKNVSDLTYDMQDFEREGTWNFFAASHGKGQYDGLGGTIKRLSSKTSLQRPFDSQLLDSEDLFQWARDSLKSANVIWVSEADVFKERELPGERFSRQKVVPRTQSYYYTVAVGAGRIAVRLTSVSSNQEDFMAEEDSLRLALE